MGWRTAGSACETSIRGVFWIDECFDSGGRSEWIAAADASSQFSVRKGSIVSESETRADLFDALHTLAEIVPQMRGGQLMAAVGELCADRHGRGLWDATDVELLEAVWQFRQGFEAATIPLSEPEAKPVAVADQPA